MPIFRKKPVTIEAIQFTDKVSAVAILEWTDFKVAIDGSDRSNPFIEIDTLEGKMIAKPGDWIIRGVKGEFYPCKPDIFAATYDPV